MAEQCLSIRQMWNANGRFVGSYRSSTELAAGRKICGLAAPSTTI